MSTPDHDPESYKAIALERAATYMGHGAMAAGTVRVMIRVKDRVYARPDTTCKRYPQACIRLLAATSSYADPCALWCKPDM